MSSFKPYTKENIVGVQFYRKSNEDMIFTVRKVTNGNLELIWERDGKPQESDNFEFNYSNKLFEEGYWIAINPSINQINDNYELI